MAVVMQVVVLAMGIQLYVSFQSLPGFKYHPISLCLENSLMNIKISKRWILIFWDTNNSRSNEVSLR